MGWNELSNASQPLFKSMRVLGIVGSFIAKAFTYILLPLTALGSLLSGLTAGWGMFAVKGTWELIKGLFNFIWNVVKGAAFAIDSAFKIFLAGFKSIGTILNPVNWFNGKMIEKLKNNIDELTTSIGTALGNLWTPLDVAENQETNATRRKNAMAMLPERQKFTGSYVGLTEGVKFAQEIQKKDNEYLKQIANSTTMLADLAKGSTQQG